MIKHTWHGWTTIEGILRPRLGRYEVGILSFNFESLNGPMSKLIIRAFVL